MNVLAIPLFVTGAFLAAWSLATIMVTILDALHLCYSSDRERDEVDHHEALPVRRTVPTPPRSTSGPIGRRIAAYEGRP